MVLSHPCSGKRHKRQPKKKVEICPEDAPRYSFRRMEQVMMIVPINSHVDEAQDVTQKDGSYRAQRLQVQAVRHLHLQHHDGDDHSEHAVAEGFHPAFIHMDKIFYFCNSLAAALSTIHSRRPLSGFTRWQ